MTGDTFTTPKTNDPSLVDTDEMIYEVPSSRRASGQIMIAVVFFGLGFIAALLLAQYSNDNAQAIYKAALDDAVAEVLTALPDRNVPVAADGSATESQPGQRVEVSPDDDPALGPEDAPILMIEFSDFRCPYCGRFATTTFASLMEQYGEQVRFVYRDFPVLGDLSFQAAEAAECANEQNAFWEYHDRLFANQQNLSTDTFVSLAGELGLDTNTFSTCLETEKYRDEIIADFNAARAAGASGTPTFVINGRLVVGAQPLEAFQTILDEELAAATSG